MKTNVKGTVKLITPELAAKLLEGNKNNRHLRESVVAAYAQDMLNGHWLLNNQGIGIGDDGTIIDGQHRLHAVVLSGCSVEMLVVGNLPVMGGSNGVKLRTVDTVDTGIIRTLPDLLTIGHSIDNANMVSASARIILELAISYNRRVSTAVFLQVYRIYGTPLKAVMAARQHIRTLTTSPVLGAFAFAAKSHQNEVIAFEEAFFSGQNLKANSPILHLRNFLLSGKVAYKKGPRSRIITSAVLSALMHHIEGQTVVRLYRSAAGLEYFRDAQEQAIDKVRAIFTLPEEEVAS